MLLRQCRTKPLHPGRARRPCGRVVIVGAGFGALWVAKTIDLPPPGEMGECCRAECEPIMRIQYHRFQPGFIKWRRPACARPYAGPQNPRRRSSWAASETLHILIISHLVQSKQVSLPLASGQAWLVSRRIAG